MYNKSPLFYVGSKHRLLEQILKHFPNNINKFIEPFVGGGVVFLNVEANEYMLNDLNPNVIEIHNLFYTYRNESELLLSELQLLAYRYGLSHSVSRSIVPQIMKTENKKTYYSKFNKYGYNLMKNDYNDSVNRDVKILYLLTIYGFNRMIRFNNMGDFNIPVGNVDFNNNVKVAIQDYTHFVRRKNINFSSTEYNSFLDSIDYAANDFVYLDPPYLASNSKYGLSWSIEDEQTLLNKIDSLDKCGVKFAVSNVLQHNGIKNGLFEEWSKKYTIHYLNKQYLSYHNNNINDTIEVLITNF